jgi:tripartite-type tricarboxylate transporter receptor subunit TctC
MKRSAFLVAAILCFVAGMAGLRAQDAYPSRPIRVIVPYAPGGATDIVARVLGDELRTLIGQSFVVENRPGAYGILAIEQMVRARPDGYTLMIGNVSTNAITPILYPGKFSIDYEKDVVPITRLVDVPAFLLAATKDFSPRTVAEFIAYAKANPGNVRYGTVGVGSYPHFDAALFAKRAGIGMIHIPNRNGATGVVNDMLRGDVQISFLNVASTAGLVKDGQLRPLALVNDKRLPEYPDVPTMAEAGYGEVGTLAWQGLFAPAGTPKDLLHKLHAAILQALKAEPVIKAFTAQNFRIVPNASLDDAKTWLAGEMSNWRKISSEVKIEISD